jgi:lysozyme
VIGGFDVSGFQGPSVPRADFVFVKATEGASYTSSRFAAQWADAKRKGMVRGAYHFARPEQSSGASQADRLISTARAVPGELLCLDLETSKVGQAVTNAWARAFGDRLRERAPGVTTVLYMGSGYAANGTGRDLSRHFDLWWYPQYPSTARTSTWRTVFDPWVPPGLTCGWARPHIWQWTDDFDGIDASISPLSLAELAAGGRPRNQEDDVPQYVSLSQKSAQAVRNGVPARVVFDVENSDRGGAHADGAFPGILSGGKSGAQFVAEVDVAGAAAVRLIEVDPAKQYAITKTYPLRVGPATFVGWCDAGMHLYAELHPTADGLASATVRAQYWER